MTGSNSNLSTTEGEENALGQLVETPGGSTQKVSKRKLMRLVDKITKSQYFQKAVEHRFVQRGMEYVSKTPIKMNVELCFLAGTLLVNIPPPPSDRLWFGFQANPQLKLKARPKVGEKMVTLNRVLDWIEQKMALEFQRVLVLPNMDDLVIPLLLTDNAECKPFHAAQQPHIPKSFLAHMNNNKSSNNPPEKNSEAQDKISNQRSASMISFQSSKDSTSTT
ncbi:hypothetical protein Ciccas_006320 [Cichlidogyrus casuarinus]|uniref:Testis-expressed sequence 2 protein n=1 Tax=Cichlidogyrus casuarinus TaxID=1844966 RepID=A0ABD2Q633_9PLAT